MKRCNGFLFLDPIMHFSMKQRCLFCYIARNSIGFLWFTGSDGKVKAYEEISTNFFSYIKKVFRLSPPIQTEQGTNMKS